MERSNEAEPDQLEVARSEGDAYAKALDAMRKEEGGVVASAGNTSTPRGEPTDYAKP